MKGSVRAGRSRAFLPSLILGEVFPEKIRRPGDIHAAMHAAIQHSFFKRFEIPVSLCEDEGREIRALVREHGVSLAGWASEELGRHGLNLSALDESERRRAVSHVSELGRRILSWGADCLGVLSGADPGESKRAHARSQLVKSLIELGTGPEAAAGLRIMLEPLDQRAHKCGLVGPTHEALETIAAAREKGASVLLSWDNGHVQLNEEALIPSLHATASVTRHIHLSNPVTDRDDPLFGDHHYPIDDSTGAGTTELFGAIMRATGDMVFPSTELVSVAVEVRAQGNFSPEQTVRHCETVLERVLMAGAVAA